MKLRLLAILCSLTFLNSCYLTKVSYVQARILLTKKDISETLKEQKETKVSKDKLSLVLESRKFAEDLGLTPHDSYLSYSDLDDIPTIYVVSAAEKFKLKSKTWWYPVVGNIPYKGFFSKEEAEQENKDLIELDLDTSVRTTSAYSTLGWFDDPILPSTINLPDEELANTVIHEISHGTFWKPNYVSFNETSSNTIGHLGATLMFKGKDQELYNKAKKSLIFECLASLDFKEAKDSLTLLFERALLMDATQNKNIEADKKQIYERLKDKIRQSRQEVYKVVPEQSKSENKPSQDINNSTFLSSFIYLDGFSKMIELYYIKKDLKSYISEIKRISSTDNPTAEIEKIIFDSGNNVEPRQVCLNLDNI